MDFLKKILFRNWLKTFIFESAHVLFRPQTFQSSRINYLDTVTENEKFFPYLHPNSWHDYQKMLLERSYSKNLEKSVENIKSFCNLKIFTITFQRPFRHFLRTSDAQSQKPEHLTHFLPISTNLLLNLFETKKS